MTMVLGSALSGNTVAATEEDQNRDGSVKVFLNVDTENSLNQDTLHKVNISAENSTDTETMLRLYLKNDGGSAAEDIEAVDLQKSLKNAVTLSDGSQTSLNAEWKINRDDNGKARSKYLQAAMPAESSLDFDVHLQYRTDESNYTKKVLVEAKAFEGEQEVTETSDSEDGNKENEVTLVWADEQAATGTEGTEAAGTESTEAAAQNAVSATASLDSKYVYLDPEGMNLNGTDWKKRTVWLFVINNNWTTKFKEGTYDSSNGYYKWPSGDWSNTDCNFFFTLSNDWNTIKMNDYYRTDVVPKIKLSQAAGKVFIQNGTASNKIDGKSVYAVKEKSDSGETPDPSGDNLVYYDATLSKLSYAPSDAADNSIPKDGELRYRAWNDTNDKEEGKLQKVKDYTNGTNKWTDVYVASLKKRYNNILFYGGSSIPDTNCAQKTEDLTIPWNTVKKPCFYADSSDDVIYGQINRNGYWDSVYKIRDAEKGKTGKDVVDIQNREFSRKSDTLYVDSTFYDYYTDYELNGNNRDNYGGDNGASHRNWVNFRQFDQALSDYYKGSNVKVPIYTGHFQPSIWDHPFSDIAYTLKLYGFDEKEQNSFMSTNNSALDVNGEGGKYDYAAQGLVARTLKDDKLLTSDAEAEEPHFNEAFLEGKNSKNAVLGQVYHNVSFPFKKEDIKGNGVNYWCFDSKKTTLAMRQDTGKNTYYLEDTGNQGWSENVNSTSGTVGTYGFFPFNETSPAASAKNYNYGFGTRMDMTFKLTDDGTVIDKNGNKVPIEFEFSGDDDVWVYIDGKLALDVGGEHGRVTGNLNFENKKATVSKVKKSAGSLTSGENVPSNFTLSGSNSDEHTLTLFYMERGMWESNMKITFNFPDENEFAVEKKVNTTDVNKDLFPDSLFDNTSVFPFTIMNQATHYGTKAANSQIAKLPKVYNDSFDNSTLSKNEVQNTFEHTAEKEGQSNVVYWKARQNDTTGSYIGNRVGIIAPARGSTFDASETNAFLQFKMYYDCQDTPALADTYVALTDSAGNEIGGYLSGKTYGISSLSGGKWNTVKVDLSKLQGNEPFDYSQIKAIKFDYNYERDIYLDDFTFIPSVILTGKTGFVTKQYEIPDYGSAKSGRLEYPKDAQYTVSKNNKKSQTYRLEDDGTFALADGETATFHDQFRRGSYISVKETVDPDVFDTSWTLYENGEAVTDMKEGSTVENTSPSPSVKDAKSSSIRDGRKEVYSAGNDSEGQRLANIGYTKTGWAKDQNSSEDQNTIVFRSYLDPDNTISSTKLKAVFVNKVKTGKIIIYKETAKGSDALNGDYSFKVEFKNIAGLSLENKAIERTYTCKAGEKIEIDRIPAGTNYRIWEITPKDGSTLESVTVNGNNSSDAGYDPVTKVVAGKVIDSTKTSATKITFYNTLKPTLNICLEKKWDKVTGLTLPDSIQIQLQRSSDSGKNWKAMDYEGRNDDTDSKVITLRPDYDGNWKYTFENLEQYVDYNVEPKIPYQYRVVEVDKDGKVITEGGYLNDVFRVNYSSVIDGSSVPVGSVDAAAKTKGYTITNTYSPKTNIKIKKQDASTKNPLNGAKFKLEKLKDDGNKNWIVDGGFKAVIKETGGNDSNNKELGTAFFSDLEDGTYRLTEIKASSDHNLLKDPITIVINRNGKSLVDNDECKIEDNTIMITISNQSKFHLPATGGYGRYLVILGGLALAGAALLRYKLQNRRKEGKHSE